LLDLCEKEVFSSSANSSEWINDNPFDESSLTFHYQTADIVKVYKVSSKQTELY
jgi:hypothetical protein